MLTKAGGPDQGNEQSTYLDVFDFIAFKRLVNELRTDYVSEFSGRREAALELVWIAAHDERLVVAVEMVAVDGGRVEAALEAVQLVTWEGHEIVCDYISVIWHNFKSLGQISEGLFNIW